MKLFKSIILFLKKLFKKKAKVVSMKNYPDEVDWLLELDETEEAISK